MYQIIREKNKWDSCIAEIGMNSVFCSNNFSRLYYQDPQLFVYKQKKDAAVFVFNHVKDAVYGLHYGGIVTNCQDKIFFSNVTSSLTKYLYSKEVRSCHIRNHPFLNTIKIGELIKEEPFIFIDLTRSSQELEATISKQHRRCIRRAKEKGLDVMYSDDLEYLKIFYEFYETRQKQLGIPFKGYVFFDQMFKFLKEHLIFSVVRDSKKILAVSLLLKDSGNVFMTYGGMSQEGYDQEAKHLMVFDAIFKFKSTSFSRFVLGTGNNGKDSIYNFKRGFTDKEYLVRSYDFL